nr:transposase [uncultured Desulfobacter sp.]
MGFNQKALARVFRARFLDGLNQKKLPIPNGVSPEWIVNCTRVGTGITALKYLSRYLYRGVISEKNIIGNRDGKVTFRYIDSTTKSIRCRTLKGEDFLGIILQHVLPWGFRRTRDYGFLHSNAKKMLSLVQLILYVRILVVKPSPKPAFKCPYCGTAMVIVGVRAAGTG